MNLKEYFEEKWPPRLEAGLAELKEVYLHQAWSRVASNDWRRSATGMAEDLFAAAHRARHCLAVTNGTVALELSLRASEVRPGDEVILPALSFVATATAVSAVGAIPRFVDVLRRDLTIDPERVLAAIGPKTRAVVAVHLAGVPCAMSALQEICRARGLALIEDCSHAHGASWDGTPVGTFGNFGAFSLQQGKLLTCGEGAFVTTNDEALFRRLFSHHTFSTSVTNGVMDAYDKVVPHNARLPNLLGGLLVAQLRELEAMQAVRSANKRRFEELMANVDGLRPLELDRRASRTVGYYVTYAYDGEARGRPSAAELTQRLWALGVPCFRGHNTPMYWREPYSSRSVAFEKDDCEIAETIAPARYINFRHEMFLADPAVMGEVVALIRKELGER